MKPTIVIPATAEASSEYRLAQSQANLAREGELKDMGRGFKRGKPLDPDSCLLTTPVDGWTPLEGRGGLKNIIPIPDQHKLDKLFSDKGLAGFIATSDTTAGVSEVITYDENEQIVKPIVEGGKPDVS